MAAGLVDTSILVDIARKYPPAVKWLKSQEQLGITPIASLEFMTGARNKKEYLRTVRLLSRFERVYLIQDDMD